MTPRSLRRAPAQITRQRGRTVIRRGVVRPKAAPSIVRRAPSGRVITKRSVRAPALIGGRGTAARKSVLRNRAFVGTRRTSLALARTHFRGQFAGKRFADPHWAHFHRRPRHHHVFVIGWIGPLFWPYAYYDFIDYTFWPYAYDTFWPYAYDDLYVSIFGPYAYVSPVYANVPAYRERGRVQRVPRGGVAQVCSAEAAGLTDWPIEQIAETVEPTEAQQALLNDLKNATTSAVELMQSACPTELPGTPTGRLAAMRTRLETMLKALTIVQPALERFYNSLSDEQKARFNAMPEASAARRPTRATETDLARACSGEAAGRMPIDRVRRAVQPSEAQNTALEQLDRASQGAAELLKANCEGDEPLTPTGRLAAMERRLKTMLEALDLVQPALEHFYGSLDDEQKERFNRLPRQG